MRSTKPQCILFDWGDTVMRNFPEFEGPMHLWPNVEPVPDIGPALQSLQPTSTLALATNAVDSGEDDIRKALQRCDLGGFFDVVFCFRKLGFRKPDRAFYGAILEGLGLEAQSVFMVGDTFESDVRAANGVGISAVWFNPTSEESRSGPLHRTIHELRDLPAALRALGARISSTPIQEVDPP
jgi:FMN phosphatase YigB (HAD superfamily)